MREAVSLVPQVSGVPATWGTRHANSLEIWMERNIMPLYPRAPIEDYLAASPVIDSTHPAVAERARTLAGGSTDVQAIARRCFEWVRDEIRHSYDHALNPVTCTASETLEAGTGYCYAKSHLLAALLRANAIPAGLCYQRLSFDDRGAPYSLHGLNAVLLPGVGWYRIDARGNKPGVDAQFCPPLEQLAFPLRLPEEAAYAEILPEPLPQVVRALRMNRTYDAVASHLPDVMADDPLTPLDATAD